MSAESEADGRFEPTYREDEDRYHLELDNAEPSVAVVSAVSTVIDEDPVAMDPTLNDVVDPDALDRLFSDRTPGDRRRGGHVVFYLGGCRVLVSDDGVVEITPPGLG